MRTASLVLVLVGALARASSGQNDRALAEQRTRIDALDVRIVALLNERAEVVREVGRIKKEAAAAASDPTRAAQVIERIASANRGPLPNEHLRRIYETILNEMTAFEAAEMSRK